MKNKLLNKKRVTQFFSLFTFLVLFVTTAKAQFNTGTITIDGTGGEAAYTSAVSGNGTNVKMAWDDTYLYIYYSAGVAAEPFNIFIDTDPSIPVATGGNGAAAGAINWGITPTLPIKADFQIYWTGSFAEYRTVSGPSFVFTATPFNNINDTYSNTGTTNRELRIRWTTMGLSGRPAAFNWMGYANSTASFIFNQVPDENPSGGSSPQSPLNNYYYTVSTTASTGTTNPFSQKSYESRATSTMGLAITTLWDYTLDAAGATTHTFTPTGTITVNNAVLIAANNTFLVGTGAVRTLQLGSTPTNTPSLTNNGTLTPNNGVGNDLNITAAFGTTTIAGTAPNTAYKIFNLTVNNGATVQAPSTGTVELGAQFGTIVVGGTLNFVNGGVVNLTNNGATASAVTINVTSTGTATFNNVTNNGFTGSSLTLANVEANTAAKLSFNDVTNNANNTIISSSGGAANTAVPITIRGNLTNTGAITTLSTSNFRNLAITVTGASSILNSSTNITYRNLTIANTGSLASNSAGVTVSGTHTITINDTRTLTINSGARLIVDPNVTISIPGTGTLQVNGFFRRGVSTITGFGATTFLVNNGGTYEHNFSATVGVIPTGTWNTGSTCAIIGYNTAGLTFLSTSGFGQSFHHFTWNCPNQPTGNLNLLGFLTTVNGNFSVLSTGAGNLIYTNAGTPTLTIGGDLIMSGNSFIANNGALSAPTFNIGGNLDISGGTFNLHNGVSGSGVSTFNIVGNFIQTGGAINKPTGPANINFIKSTGIQTFTQSGGGTMGNAFVMNVGNGTTTNTLQFLTNANLGGNPFTFNVLNNAGVDFQTFVLSGSGTFSAATGSTITTANVEALGAINTTAVAAGSVRISTRAFSNAGVNYVFNGASAQLAGNAIGVSSLANLTINNSSGVTLSANTDVTGTLTLPSTNTLTLGGFNLTVSAAGNNNVAGIIAGTGALVKAGAGTLTLTASILNNTAHTYTAGTTVNGAGTGTIAITGLANITAATITSAAQSVTFSTTTPANGSYQLLPGALTVGTQSFTHNADATKVVTFNYANSTVTVASPVAGDYRTITSGNWTTLTTWERWNGTAWATPLSTSPEGYPGQYNTTATTPVFDQRAYISNGHSITVDSNIAYTDSFTRIEFLASSLTGNTSLTFAPNVSLSMNGSVVIEDTNGNNTISVGSGSLSCTQMRLTNSSGTDVSEINVTTGRVTISSTTTGIQLNGTTARSIFRFTDSGSLNINQGITGSGAFIAGTSTVTFGYFGNQTLSNNVARAFHNVVLSGSGIKTFDALTTITRSLTISGTATVNLPGTVYTVPSLVFGTAGQIANTYGGTNSSTAANKTGPFDTNITTGNITVTSNLPFVRPNVATYTYNGLPQGSTPTNSGTGTSYTYSYTNNGGTAYGPTATAPTNVGNYFVTVTVAANAPWLSNSSAVTGYSIVPRALNITASNGTKIFGETYTTGAGSTLFTSSGLQNSQTIGTVTIASTGAASGAIAGTYDIVPTAATGGTFTATNYTISYVNGTLTVSNPTTGDYRTAASGNWSVLATWERWNGTAWATPTTGQGYPGQTAAPGIVYIQNSHAIIGDRTVTGVTRIGQLIFSIGVGNSSLTISSTNSIQVQANVIVQSGGNRDINVGAGFLSVGAITFSDTGSDSIDSKITIATGAVFVSGSLVMQGSSNRNAVEFTGSGSLQFINNGTMTGGALIPATGTVHYTWSGNQTVGTYAYTNLVLGNGGIKTVTATTTISSNLTIRDAASASLNAGTIYNIGTLTLGCLGRENGSWGSSGPDPDPTYVDDIYFQNTTGFINVATNTRPIPVTTQTQPTCIVGGIITVTPVADATSYTVTGTSPVVAAVTNATGVFSGLAAGTYSVYFTNPCGTSITVTSITISALETKTWNGTSWSPSGAPTANENILFTANYAENTDVTACACTVNSGTVNFLAGRYLKLGGRLTVNSPGTLTFENNSSLVQTTFTGSNTGNITYKRANTTFVETDYTYWSSPVALQNLFAVSPLTKADKFYSFNPDANDWVQESPSSTTMIIGKGYIIRGIPQPAPPDPPGFHIASFIGVPNNGDQSIAVSGGETSNLIGNPYPSAIDANAFLAANAAAIDGTIYLWTHSTEIQSRNLITGVDEFGTPKAGSGELAYTSDDYATYNGTGGVAAISGGVEPTGKIAAGQSFFSTSTNLGGTVNFTNAMRVDSSGNSLDNSNFYKTKNQKSKSATAIEKNRVWLNLSNNQGAFKQTLVGYITDATNEYDSRFDGESYDGNNFIDFYSVNSNKNLTIQGRALPFDENDEVILGYRSTINGKFTININQLDGLLINKAIFIEDKLANTIFDLKGGNYTFNTDAGTFNNRFVLRYTDKTLGVEKVENKDEISVLYSNNLKSLFIRNYVKDTVVNSVTLYNILGQKLANWDVKDKEQTNIQIPINNLPTEIYIVKIKTNLGESSKKIILK